MVSKSSLAKKLASYSAVAGAVLVTGKNANSQIVYTNITSGDTVGRYDLVNFKLDLDNDGVYDFDFKRIGGEGYSGYVYEIWCDPYSQNNVLGSMFPTPLNFGDTIDAQKAPWGGEQWLGMICNVNGCDPVIDTDWINKEHYIGLRILKNKQTYYGWARLTVDYGFNSNYNDNDIFAFIDEYAVNTKPDSAIYAGEECAPNYPKPSLQIKNDTLSTNAVTNIQWYVNNKPIAGGTSQSITLSQFGLYQVKEGDTSQCYTESTVYDYLDCAAYKPNIGPAIQTTCIYNSKILYVDSPAIGYSIKWFFNDTLLLGDTLKNLKIGNRGNYFAVIYRQGGCYDTTNTVNLLIDTIPISPLIVQHKDTMFAERKYGVFPSNVTYQWYDQYGYTLTNATKYYYVLKNLEGTYYVTVTDTDSCSDESPRFTVTGINYIDFLKVIITENNNLLSVKFKDEPYKGYKLVIYNYLGQKIYNSEITSGEMTFNLSSITKGLYLVTLENENSRVVKKIVLQ